MGSLAWGDAELVRHWPSVKSFSCQRAVADVTDDMGERVSIEQTLVSYLPMVARVAVTGSSSEYMHLMDMVVAISGQNLPIIFSSSLAYIHVDKSRSQFATEIVGSAGISRTNRD